MKAIVLNEAGAADKMIYQEIEKPVLKSGEILVKVKNIGINLDIPGSLSSSFRWL